MEIEHWNGNCDVYLVHTVHDSESHARERSDKVSLCPVNRVNSQSIALETVSVEVSEKRFIWLMNLLERERRG